MCKYSLVAFLAKQTNKHLSSHRLSMSEVDLTETKHFKMTFLSVERKENKDTD